MRRLTSLITNTLAYLLIGATNGHGQAFSSLVQKFISVNADTIAFINATIVDGTGGPVRTNQTLIVAGGRIIALGPNSSSRLPGGAKQIDCTGKTLIPGMIMMHEHMFYGESLPPQYLGMEMPVSFPRLYLAGGVTTMRTAGSVEPQTDLNIRDQIRAGKLPGPEIDVTAPYIERPGRSIPEFQFIHSPEEAGRLADYWIAAGCTSFKAYMDLSRADLAEVIKIAHAHKLKVTGHLCSVTFREAADLGIDNLEHGFWVSSDFDKSKKPDQCSPASQEYSVGQLEVNSQEMLSLIDYLVSKKVTITSTLPVFEPYAGREIFPGDGGEALTPVIRELIEKKGIAALLRDSITQVMFKKEMAWEKLFVERGGRLMAGIDPTGAGRVIPGYADRHIPELLVEAGFSFPEAIKICSLNAAEYLGQSHDKGSIEVGKIADLVLINGEPMKDVKAMRNTETVFKQGVGFDSKRLFESVREKVGLY